MYLRSIHENFEASDFTYYSYVQNGIYLTRFEDYLNFHFFYQ